MQILYWLFVEYTSHFSKNYYILQFLTIGHHYPVPVVKHNRDEKFTASSPPVGSKVKYVNFAITQSVVNIFY